MEVGSCSRTIRGTASKVQQLLQGQVVWRQRAEEATSSGIGGASATATTD
jgi:hypothetical protein